MAIGTCTPRARDLSQMTFSAIFRDARGQSLQCEQRHKYLKAIRSISLRACVECGKDRAEPPQAEQAGQARCCARRERPRGHRAAEQSEERAPPHSITSSARPESGSGIVRPSALAGLRLMISSIFVACCAARSAGAAALMI